MEKEICKNCKGKGEVNSVPCTTCEGTGVVDVVVSVE